jgi:DNA repair exonuclease SbcCD nuclease subunit
MAVKFLHTADWQMGMKALQAGEKAKAVRAKRFETAERVVELAKREHVDFVVVAGDLFEHHDVDAAVVHKTVAVLDRFAPIPVFILPGNHDPLVDGGVWDRPSWQRVGGHVKLLREAAEVPVHDGVALYPSPLKQKQSGLDPTAWIPARAPEDARIRIGVAHGALDVLPERGNFPIAAHRAEEAGLDYLALGDWHSFVHNGRTVYSGTPEQTSFREKDPGHVVIVEISGAGAEPRVSKRPVGALRWTEHHCTICDRTDVDSLRTALRHAGPVANQLLRIESHLDPSVPPDVLDELRALWKELSEEAFFLDWPVETLDIAPDVPTHLPAGLVADIDEALAAILAGRVPDGPASAAAREPAEVIHEARALLRRIVRELQP